MPNPYYPQQQNSESQGFSLKATVSCKPAWKLVVALVLVIIGGYLLYVAGQTNERERIESQPVKYESEATVDNQCGPDGCDEGGLRERGRSILSRLRR